MANDDHGTHQRVVYAVPVAVSLRGVGVGTVGLALCFVGARLLVEFWPSRPVGVALTLLLALAALLALLVLGVGVLRLLGRGARLVLDEEGFVNATGPGAGVRRALWRDVRKVQVDGRFVSIELTGSRRSLIRTGALEVDSKELARQLRARLNRGHGYRPLVPPS